jgi:SET domain-containing protein
MLEIKTSSLSRAGLGVFALKDIEKGSIITEYYGKIISKQEYFKLRSQVKVDPNSLSKQDYKEILSSAILTVGSTTVIGDLSVRDSSKCGQLMNDAMRCMDSFLDNGSYNPRSIELYNQSRDECSAAPELIDGKIMMVAQNHIHQGDEIFHHYGFRYWVDLLPSENKLNKQNNVSLFLWDKLVSNALEKKYTKTTKNLT